MIVLLYVIPVLVLVLLTWIMVRAFLHFERCKKAVVEGIATLGEDRLAPLGWKSGPYISLWKALPFQGSGWTLHGNSFRDQMLGLQRVAIRGLPTPDEMEESVRKSARAFRLYFWIVGVPGLSLVYLVGSAKIGVWLGNATSTPPVYWFTALVGVIAIGVVLPFEKYRKWPTIEDTQ